MSVSSRDYPKLCVGDYVITLHGTGQIIIVEGEDHRSLRYGVFLDNNPYDYTPVYFWPYEVIKESKE